VVKHQKLKNQNWVNQKMDDESMKWFE